jgi:acetyl esterase/lipase
MSRPPAAPYAIAPPSAAPSDVRSAEVHGGGAVPREARVSVTEGVVFGTGGGRELRCDVYAPVGATAPLPGVLLLHGGAWRRGDRSRMRGYGLRVGRLGFVCVAPEYRLTGESPWPAQIHDVKAALRFMRASAGSLGIDAARLCVQGSSAGGHLALLAAGTPGHPALTGEGGHAGVDEHVAAVVAVYPPTDFSLTGSRASGTVPAGALLSPGAALEAVRLAAPIAHVTGRFPPTFLIHGSGDRVVPPSASLRMYEALRAAGVAVELRMLADLPHGFANEARHQRQLAPEIAAFLARMLSAGRAETRRYAEA